MAPTSIGKNVTIQKTLSRLAASLVVLFLGLALTVPVTAQEGTHN